MASTETTSQTCPNCGATVDTTDADPLMRIPCPNCGEKVKVDRAFNNFVLEETLGIGGMGTVYKARDTLLDRLVALKLLRKDLGEEGGEEVDYTTRLQQEARVAASVNHPNVIQVFSSGMDHGQFYLVMELVDHGSLDDFIEQRKRLPEEHVLETGIQVAKGLRAAYSKGLIHRDVKPANILFADEQTAKIGDFGLAGVAAETGETKGEIWGTPYYVAPERLDSKPEDFRSDIYSLGATLFHAVTGRAPIEGDTNSATTLRELKEKPLDVRSVVPDVTAATARVFHRMLAPDPENRFSSYDELVTELQNAQKALRGEDIGGGESKAKAIWIVGGGLLLLAAIAVGFLIFGPKPKTPVGPAAPVISLSDLERRFVEARKDLLAGRQNVAHGAFARIASDARGRQPLYDWLLMHQGFSALIGREKSQTQQAFQDVENAGQTGFAKEDSELARFFVTTAKAMSAPGVTPGAVATQKRAGDYEIFGWLLYALKDLERADVTNAVTLLEAFVAAQPSGKYAWIAEYKPIAQKYLDDAKRYSDWKKEAKEATTKEQLNASLDKLRTARKQMKTRTSLSDDLAAEEKTLTRRVSDQEKTETTKQNEEKKKVLDQEAPTWNAAVTVYRQRVSVYDFNGARDVITSARVSEESLRAAQAALQKKAQWLIDWKAKLMDDLNRTHFGGAISEGGAQYTGIDGATADKLSLKNPYGSAQFPWTKLPPTTLLSVAMSFIKPNVPDVADRQWLSAVFAAETGQAQPARDLSEKAAAAKPEYRDQIPLLNQR